MKDLTNQKSIVLIFLSLTTIGFGLNSLFASNVFCYKISPQIIDLDIALGRGPNCTGRGICKLKLFTSSKRQQFNVKGGIYFNDANKLTLNIYKKHVDELTKNQQIIDSKFEIIDRYVIPMEIMDQLGVSGTYSIEMGEYQVTETSESYEIDF